MQTSSDYFKIPDLVSRWKISESTVRRKIREGKITAFHIGRVLRIERSEVERVEAAWKAGITHQPETQHG